MAETDPKPLYPTAPQLPGPVADPAAAGDFDKGIGVGCRYCTVAKLYDPGFDWRSTTEDDRFNYLLKIAPHFGWTVGEFTKGYPFFVCPKCSAERAAGKTLLLPKYDEACRCPACGFAEVGTRYCPGYDLRQCVLNAPGRGHLHRTCKRCGHDFLQAALTDLLILKGTPACPSKKK